MCNDIFKNLKSNRPYLEYLQAFCIEHNIRYNHAMGVYEFIHDGVLYKLCIGTVNFTGKSKNKRPSPRPGNTKNKVVSIKIRKCDIIKKYKEITGA